MKKSIRLVSAALALTLGCSAAALPAAAAAQESATKDESVYVTLAPDGSVQQQTVSVWLHRDSGLDGFADVSCLEAIHDLKGTAVPTQTGEQLTWKVEAPDLYYQGTTGRQLPITAAITYELDGQPLTAGQLLGKSGHLKVTIALTNHERRTVTIDGSPRAVYTPFAAAVGATLDADRFTNIKAEHGTVQTDSARAAVAWVCLPGMAETFDGLLTGSLREVQDKFVDTVTLEANVTDCPALSFLIGCAADPSALSGMDEFEQLGTVSEDLDQLREATDQLLTGTADLLDGVLQLHDAVTGELTDGVVKLDDSVKGQLTTGAAQLRDGLAALNSNSAALNDGAAAVIASVLASATATLRSQVAAQLVASAGMSPDAAAAAAASQVPDLTLDNYQQVIDSLLGSSTQAAQAAILNAIHTGAASVSDLTPNECAALCVAWAKFADQGTATALQSAEAKLTETATINTALEKGQAALANQDPADVQQQIEALMTVGVPAESASTVLAYMTGSGNTDPAAAAAALATLQEYGPLVAAATSAAAQSALSGFAAQEAANDPQLQAASAQLRAAANSLAQLRAFRDGLSAYTAGVASAADGGQQLYNGIAGDLASGTGSLRAAVTGQLTEGVDALLDGTHQLADGMTEYDAEGIQQLTGRQELSQLQALADTADALRAASESYTSYTGAPENTACTVKFIMKTQAPEPEPDEDEAADAAAEDGNDAPAQPAPEPEKPSFWQRLVSLFTGKR